MREMLATASFKRKYTREQVLCFFILPFMAACRKQDNTPTPLPLKIDVLTPKGITQGADWIIYPQGAIINATKGVYLAVFPANLQAVNTDPVFNIKLSQDEQNITYLIPGSFADGSRLQEAARIAGEELPLALSALHDKFGLQRGRARFSIISMADVIKNVSRRNPGLTPKESHYLDALSVELGHAYIGTGQKAIFDAYQTPNIYPDISASIRTYLFERKLYPFAVTAINPNYLAALNLSHF